MSVGGGHRTARYATRRRPLKCPVGWSSVTDARGRLQACTHPDFLYDAHTRARTHRVAQKWCENGQAQKVNQRTAIGNWIEPNEWIGRALSCASVLRRRSRTPHARRTEESTATTTSGAAAVSVVARSIAAWR